MSTTSDNRDRGELLLRPLGMLEKLYTARHVLGVYNSVVITATYTLATNIEDTALYSTFHAAIPELLRLHQSLCCYFEGEGTSEPVFRRLDGVRVEDVLQVVGLDKHESLSRRLQDLHDQRWDVEGKPLWKVVVMRDHSEFEGDAKGGSLKLKLHVAFVYHHVIGDGLSGAAFHRSLLRILDTIDPADLDLRASPEVIETSGSISLIEPIEKLVSMPLSWPFLTKQVLEEYAPRWLIGAPLPLWAGLPPQALDQRPYRSRNRTVAIGADEMNVLLKESRKHGVSITSLLTATIACTLANAVSEAPRFVGSVPYTLRRATGTSMDEMVNQSTGLFTAYPAETLDRIRKASMAAERVESIWDTASFFHAQLQDELARCPSDNLVGLLPYVADYVKFYQKKFGKAREATWELSNLGVFKTASGSTSGRWRLQSMTFTQGAQPVGAAFSVNCVCVHDGPLTIALTWQDSVVDESIIDALAKAFTALPDLLLREDS